MSAAAASASTVYLAYTGTNGAVYVRNAAQPAQAATALGGRLIGGPAAAVVPPARCRRAQCSAVFGRGTDNALWWRHQTASGWTRWQSLGGVLISNPAAVTDMTIQFGVLNVFAGGTGGGIWYRVWPANTGVPQKWTLLGGTSSIPTIHLLPGTGPGGWSELLAAAATNRHVWLLGRGGMANHLVDYGGRTTANPAVTLAAGAPVVAFARGTDNALWYTVSGYPIGGPGPWHPLGGKLISGVTATTVTGGKTYVLALGTDNQIWMRAGIWRPWPLDAAVARPDRKGFLAADGNREPPGNLN